MFVTLITAYFYFIFLAVLSTIVLILSGGGWGDWPHKYLKLVCLLQSYFTEDGVVLGSIERNKTGTRRWLFGRTQVSTPDDILDESADELLLRSDDDASSGTGSDFDAASSARASAGSGGGLAGGLQAGLPPAGCFMPPLGWHLELLRDGIESVIQDEISDIFAQSAAYRNAEPRSLRALFFHFARERRRYRRRMAVQRQRVVEERQRQQIETDQRRPSAGVLLVMPEHALLDTTTTAFPASLTSPASEEGEDDLPLRFRPFLRSCLLLLVSRCFRVGILFPIRIGIFLASFVFLAVVCLSACFIDYAPLSKTRIAVTYCRLFTAGTGLIARYHNPEHRPRRPGVAVANHLSPNDIQIICADLDRRREELYILTGQKHHGIIWTIERLVERMCPAIWLERSSAEDRKRFTNQVLDVARETGPILIFPEGYCTNNQKVLQFRRAVFDETIIIYPIAIRQDARYGDSYWSEKHFFTYLFRLLTSWAVVYDVYYLPSRTRRPDETSTEFASAIQGAIADYVGLECANFDAGLFYKQSERLKYRKLWNAECAKRVQSIVARTTPTSAYRMPGAATFADDAAGAKALPSVSHSDKSDSTSLSRARAMSVSTQKRLPPMPASREALCLPLINGADAIRPDDLIDSDAEIVEDWPPASAASDCRVLKRRRFNSLHVLKRQFSSDADDNSDNAQLRG